MKKIPDRTDRRISLLSLAPKGISAIQSLFPELRQINDLFFELDSRTEFDRLCKTLERLVENSDRALELVKAIRHDPGIARKRRRSLVNDSR